MSAVTEKLNDIRAFIFEWLDDLLDYPVILSDQHDPRPNPPYVAFDLLTGFVKQGTADEIRWNSNDSAWDLIGRRNITVSFKATGTSLDGSYQSRVRSSDLLADIQWSLDKPATVEDFKANDLGIVDEAAIQDISEVENNLFVPKHVLDIIFSTTITEQLDTYPIEKVTYSGDLLKIDGTIDQSVGPDTIDSTP